MGCASRNGGRRSQTGDEGRVFSRKLGWVSLLLEIEGCAGTSLVGGWEVLGCYEARLAEERLPKPELKAECASDGWVSFLFRLASATSVTAGSVVLFLAIFQR